MSSNEYKIAFLGGGAVGKSPIIVRLIGNRFIEAYDPTIEDTYKKTFEVNGKQCSLKILDTAGLEEYLSMIESYARENQGFVLVYSITSLCSFNEVNDYYEDVIRARGTRDVPFVLVGNKCDLESSREVTTEQGEELARQLNCPFFETSAKNGTHIEDVFTEIVLEIKAHPLLDPEPDWPPEGDKGDEGDEGSKKKNKFLRFFKRK